MHNRKLGRTSDHRKALLRNQATSLILHGRLETTDKKALELKSVVEKLITVAKKDDLNARRKAAAYLYNSCDKSGKSALDILFKEIAPKYSDRKGGYTRVSRLGKRRGDSAEVAIIELV